MRSSHRPQIFYCAPEKSAMSVLHSPCTICSLGSRPVPTLLRSVEINSVELPTITPRQNLTLLQQARNSGDRSSPPPLGGVPG